MRGKVIEEKLEIEEGEEEKKLTNAREAVKECYRMLDEGTFKEIYTILTKGGIDKPKYIKLVGQLPEFSLQNFAWQFLQRNLLFENLPIGLDHVKSYSFLKEGAHVQVRTQINLSVLQGPQQYLAYSEKGEKGITHKALVAKQTQNEIIESGQLKVKVSTIDGTEKEVNVSLDEVIALNAPTAYQKNALGHFLFQDSVTCNYCSKMVRVKLLECCYNLQPIISKMNFTQNTPLLLQQQKKCT